MLDRNGNAVSDLFHSSQNIDCDFCCNFLKCLIAGLSLAQLRDFYTLKLHQGPYEVSDYIYRMEAVANYLYIVKSGSVKVEVITVDGTRHVTGFYFAGDLVACESIGLEIYGSDCIAMEQTALCKLPYLPFLSLCSSVPKLHQNFMNILARRIRASNVMSMHRRSVPATWRLLYFLYQYSVRTCSIRSERRSATIRLPMSKGDIANYLGITPESLSRAFASLESKYYLRREHNNIKLIGLAKISRELETKFK